jgi:hypothetical protein
LAYSDDWDRSGLLRDRARSCRAHRDNDIDVASNQVGCQFAKPIWAPFCISALYDDILTLRVTKLVQSLQEGVEHVGGRVWKLGAAG